MNGNNNPDATIDGKLSGLDEFIQESFKSLDDSVLILDDLERSEIPSSVLLGIVNRLVEHGNTRVILVANTEKHQDKNFSVVQEKLVGQSFKLCAAPESALTAFISEIKPKCLSEVISRHEGLILSLYQMPGHQNLRSLRQYIWFLCKFFEKIKNEHLCNEKLISDLIVESFILFIEFKLNLDEHTASLNPQSLLKTFPNTEPDSTWVVGNSYFGNENKPDPIDKILKKYGHPTGLCTSITVGEWVSILETGVIVGERVQKQIAAHLEDRGWSSWPSWKRLWHFRSWDFSKIPHTVFESDIRDLKENLDRGSYQNPAEFLMVSSICIMLSSHSIFGQDKSKTAQELEAYIDLKLIPHVDIAQFENFNSRLSLSGFDGLGFAAENDPTFKQIEQHLRSQLDLWHENWLRTEAGKELLSFALSDNLRFLGNLTIINTVPEQRFLDTPILAHIEPDEFVRTWLQMPRLDEWQLACNLSSRYQYRPELLKDEGPWWKEVKEKLKENRNREKCEPRAVQIQLLEDSIDSSILVHSVHAKR